MLHDTCSVFFVKKKAMENRRRIYLQKHRDLCCKLKSKAKKEQDSNILQPVIFGSWKQSPFAIAVAPPNDSSLPSTFGNIMSMAAKVCAGIRLLLTQVIKTWAFQWQLLEGLAVYKYNFLTKEMKWLITWWLAMLHDTSSVNFFCEKKSINGEQVKNLRTKT